VLIVKAAMIATPQEIASRGSSFMERMTGKLGF
jgi:hypothetical protein